MFTAPALNNALKKLASTIGASLVRTSRNATVEAELTTLYGLDVTVAGKEPAIAAAAVNPTTYYWRGDKTWALLNAAAVGLGNVSNTSDANKPISTATQNALNAKLATNLGGALNGYMPIGNDGRTYWPGTTGFAGILSHNISASRIYTFPDKSGTVAMLSDLASAPITVYAQTADQVITSGGGLTIAHGLGQEPKFVEGFLRCIGISSGFAIGDVTPALPYPAPSGNSGGMALTWDATNIYVRYGSATNVFSIPNKATGVVATSSNANWNLFLRMMA